MFKLVTWICQVRWWTTAEIKRNTGAQRLTSYSFDAHVTPAAHSRSLFKNRSPAVLRVYGFTVDPGADVTGVILGFFVCERVGSCRPGHDRHEGEKQDAPGRKQLHSALTNYTSVSERIYLMYMLGIMFCTTSSWSATSRFHDESCEQAEKPVLPSKRLPWGLICSIRELDRHNFTLTNKTCSCSLMVTCHNGSIRLFSIHNTRVTVSHLRKLYHLAGYTDTKGAIAPCFHIAISKNTL